MAFSGVWRSLATLVPLALLVLLTVGQSSSGRCRKWHEFNRSLTTVKGKLQSCPEDCNSTQIIDPKCKCLSLNTSESCVLAQYLISGVEALNQTLPESSGHINRLHKKLFTFTFKTCQFPESLDLPCQASVSPGSFIETLDTVQQHHSSQDIRKDN